jgi:hypothetical protein
MWCHYFVKNTHNTAYCKGISLFIKHRTLSLKPNLDLERDLWSSFLKKSIHSKGSCNLTLKRLQAAKRGTRKAQFLLSTEINLKNRSYEDEEYFFNSPKPFCTNKIIAPNNQPLSWW